MNIIFYTYMINKQMHIILEKRWCDMILHHILNTAVRQTVKLVLLKKSTLFQITSLDELVEKKRTLKQSGQM
jgi:hypothetical protein